MCGALVDSSRAPHFRHSTRQPLLYERSTMGVMKRLYERQMYKGLQDQSAEGILLRSRPIYPKKPAKPKKVKPTPKESQKELPL